MRIDRSKMSGIEEENAEHTSAQRDHCRLVVGLLLFVT